MGWCRFAVVVDTAGVVYGAVERSVDEGCVMSDPVIEASRRAFNVMWPDQGDFEFNLPTGQRRWADAAAYEALVPIRDLHRPFVTNDPRSPHDVVCNHCLGPKKWPCPTALYAYATEEL